MIRIVGEPLASLQASAEMFFMTIFSNMMIYVREKQAISTFKKFLEIRKTFCR